MLYHVKNFHYLRKQGVLIGILAITFNTYATSSQDYQKLGSVAQKIVLAGVQGAIMDGALSLITKEDNILGPIIEENLHLDDLYKAVPGDKEMTTAAYGFLKGALLGTIQISTSQFSQVTHKAIHGSVISVLSEFQQGPQYTLGRLTQALPSAALKGGVAEGMKAKVISYAGEAAPEAGGQVVKTFLNFTSPIKNYDSELITQWAALEGALNEQQQEQLRGKLGDTIADMLTSDEYKEFRKIVLQMASEFAQGMSIDLALYFLGGTVPVDEQVVINLLRAGGIGLMNYLVGNDYQVSELVTYCADLAAQRAVRPSIHYIPGFAKALSRDPVEKFLQSMGRQVSQDVSNLWSSVKETGMNMWNAFRLL